MNLTQIIPAGIGSLCLGACIKSDRNPMQKYDLAELRNQIYVVNGQGVIGHPEVGATTPFAEGELLDVREFQSADYTVALPDTPSVFWVVFNLNPNGKDFTVERLSEGQSSVAETRKATVVCVSGDMSVNGVEIHEGKFAYLPDGETADVEVSSDTLAFLLVEVE